MRLQHYRQSGFTIIVGVLVLMTMIITLTSTNVNGVPESTQKQWTAQWWQWVMSHNDTNVLLDPTGTNIMRYQPEMDDVYFLTGAYNSNLTRNVTIPEGKTILLPVLNGVQFCLNCNVLNVIGLRDKLIEKENINNNALFMKAELDGKTIPYVRITSELFDVPIKDNNPIYTTWDYTGKVLPALADGYWVMLPPNLEPGKYHLYTHGILSMPAYSTQVRYNIEIR